MRRNEDGWNHNVHYHDFVLGMLSPGCRRALDVGCGDGELTLKLVQCCDEVVGIDVDAAAIERARRYCEGAPRISLRLADFLGNDLPDGSFDFVVAVASLHHLPLERALVRLRDLLSPGGKLAVVGLYRLSTPMDYVRAGIAAPVSWFMKRLRGEATMSAPISAPKETLQDIRTAALVLLPGACMRVRVFYRYTLVWRKP
jgi:SAM-dependent methyltransferase